MNSKPANRLCSRLMFEATQHVPVTPPLHHFAEAASQALHAGQLMPAHSAFLELGRMLPGGLCGALQGAEVACTLIRLRLEPGMHCYAATSGMHDAFSVPHPTKHTMTASTYRWLNSSHCRRCSSSTHMYRHEANLQSALVWPQAILKNASCLITGTPPRLLFQPALPANTHSISIDQSI